MSIVPGATQVRRTPRPPHSVASVRVIDSTAARAAEEWNIPGMPRRGESTMLIDLAVAVRQHALGRREARELPHGVEVEPHDGAEAVEADLLGGLDELPARVVHEHVERPVGRDDRGHELLRASGSRTSQATVRQVAAARADRLRGLLE